MAGRAVAWLAAAALLNAPCRAAEAAAAVVVVGMADESSVRVLVDPGTEGGGGVAVSLAVRRPGGGPASSPVAQTQREVPGDLPTVLRLDGLSPDTFYTGTVTVGSPADQGVEVPITFRTAGGVDVDALFASCNRVYEDKDGSFFPILTESRPEHAKAFFMGDQVYADSVRHRTTKALTADVETAVVPTLAAVFAEFQAVYRRTWGHPSVAGLLRAASNVMLPDDHDIMNNFDHRHADYFFVAEDETAEIDAKFPHAVALKRKLLMRRIITAGILSYYLYQNSLKEDAPDGLLAAALRVCELDDRRQSRSPDEAECFSSVFAILEAQPVYGTFREGAVKVVLVDTRFEKFREAVLAWRAGTQREAREHAMFGSRQFAWLQGVVKEAGDQIGDPTSGVRKVLVLSSVPLMLLPAPSARLADWFDNEMYPTHPHLANDTDSFFDLFLRSRIPTGHMLLIAGDSHLHVTGNICLSDRSNCMPQVITSGLSTGSTVFDSNILFSFVVINTFFMGRPQLPSGTFFAADVDTYHFGKNAVRLRLPELDVQLVTDGILDAPCPGGALHCKPTGLRIWVLGHLFKNFYTVVVLLGALLIATFT
ncbi:hypothetical protein DIPPA_30375 [Diplonema papillatum]|nr:hypothetical protein DIPPA_30375 [Diplonema papillatum]